MWIHPYLERGFHAVYHRFVSTVARSIVRISATAIDRAKSFRAVCGVSRRVETLDPWGSSLGRAKPLREPAKTISPVLELYPDASDLKHLPLLCYVSDAFGAGECRRHRRVPRRTRGEVKGGVCRWHVWKWTSIYCRAFTRVRGSWRTSSSPFSRPLLLHTLLNSCFTLKLEGFTSSVFRRRLDTFLLSIGERSNGSLSHFEVRFLEKLSLSRDNSVSRALTARFFASYKNLHSRHL